MVRDVDKGALRRSSSLTFGSLKGFLTHQTNTERRAKRTDNLIVHSFIGGRASTFLSQRAVIG
jgi:hypothetical protein